MACSLLLLAVPIFLVNRLVDPHWIWGSTNALNIRSIPVDTRIQRINLAMQSEFARKQFVVLGSSRVANYRIPDAKQGINFAVHGMLAQELSDALAAAEEINGGPFRRVYVGLDFMTFSGQYIPLYPSFSSYLQRVKNPLYKFKATMSLASLIDSFRTTRASLALTEVDCSPCYSRDRYFILEDLSGDAWSARMHTQIQSIRQRYARFWASPTYFESLEKFNNYAGDRALVFITPEHLQLHQLIRSEGLEEEYKEFLRKAVRLFGAVIVFDPSASAWSSQDTFFDVHHPKPSFSTMISECLHSQGRTCRPELGAKILDANSVESYIRALGLG